MKALINNISKAPGGVMRHSPGKRLQGKIDLTYREYVRGKIVRTQGGRVTISISLKKGEVRKENGW